MIMVSIPVQVSDFEMMGSMVRMDVESKSNPISSEGVNTSSSEDQPNFMQKMVQIPEPNLQASSALKAGVPVNGYVYVKELGSGTHGDVCLVQEQATGEVLTMKVVTQHP